MAVACSWSALLEGRLDGGLERTVDRPSSPTWYSWKNRMDWSSGVSRPLPDMQQLAADDDAAGLRSACSRLRDGRATGQLESDSRDDFHGALIAGHSTKDICEDLWSRTKRLGS